LNLLPTESSYTTPWHCCIALRDDGSVTSAPKGDFEENPVFELIWENGRPSYFRENSTSLLQKQSLEPPES